MSIDQQADREGQACPQRTEALILAGIIRPEIIALLSAATISCSCRSFKPPPRHHVTNAPTTYRPSAPSPNTSQNPPTVPYYKAVNDQIYIGAKGGHWVKSKTDDGSIVTLEDGSVWQVGILDRVNTMLWIPMTNISVVEADGGYLLVNSEDGETAHAALLKN